MIPSRLIRKALTGWFCWRSRRVLHRAYPRLAEWRHGEAKCRKTHKRGSAAIYRQRREFMTEMLAREIGAE